MEVQTKRTPQGSRRNREIILNNNQQEDKLNMTSEIERREIENKVKKKEKIAGGLNLWQVPINRESDKWTNITTKHMRNGAKKLTNSDLYNENNTGIHNMATKLLNKCIQNGKDLPKIANVITLVVKIFDKNDKEFTTSDAPKVRKFVLSLTKTDPKILFATKKAVWTNKGLLLNAATLCWTVAYEIFGAIWKGENQKYFTNLQGDRFGEANNLDPKDNIKEAMHLTKKRDTNIEKKKM